MKLMESVTRRKLIESTTHSMLLLPLLRVFRMDEAIGAEGILPRAIFVHWPCGSYEKDWFPSGGTGPLGELKEVSSPLGSFKDDLIMFKGICQRGSTNHDGGPFQVLAGWGKGGEQNYNPVTAPDANPYSIDERLADKWGENSVKRAIRLSVGFGATRPKNALCFSKDGKVQDFFDNPQAAYSDYFGGYSVAGIAGPTNELALAQNNVLTGKKRLIDYLTKDIKKIKTILGPLEGNKFEIHVAALDEIAKEIQKQEDLLKPDPGGNTGGGEVSTGKPPKLSACNPNDLKAKLTQSGTDWYLKAEMLPTVYQLHRQIMVQALACGVSRIGVLGFGKCDVDLFFPYLGGSLAYHSTSHGPAGAGLAKIQKKIMEEVALMVKDLKEVKSGDKTLWDHVAMLGATDIGDDPNSHDNHNIACFIAGRLGDKIKGNKYITFPYTPRAAYTEENNGVAYNKVLQTFASLVGEKMDTIGAAGYPGTIAEVLKT